MSLESGWFFKANYTYVLGTPFYIHLLAEYLELYYSYERDSYFLIALIVHIYDENCNITQKIERIGPTALDKIY